MPGCKQNPVVECNAESFFDLLRHFPYLFLPGPIPGIPKYVWLMRDNIIVNPPDVDGHVPRPIVEMPPILLFAPILKPNGAMGGNQSSCNQAQDMVSSSELATAGLV